MTDRLEELSKEYPRDNNDKHHNYHKPHVTDDSKQSHFSWNSSIIKFYQLLLDKISCYLQQKQTLDKIIFHLYLMACKMQI